MAKKKAAAPAGKKKAAAPAGKKKAAAPRARKPVEIDETTIDDAFMAACENVAGKNGWKGDSIVGSDARKLLVGLPVPSLAVEMLLMCTCWPLGRFCQIIGEEGCGKSTLLYEILRWVFLHRGYGHIMENENKDNAAVREAILEYNEQWIERRLRLDWTGSMDAWLERLRRNVAEIKVLNEGKADESAETRRKRFGWRSPYIYLVDSIMATATEKRQSKINEDGAPTQDFAREAGMLADDVRTWPRMLRGTSMIVIGTNHMKPAQDGHGNPVPRSPGGKSIKFQEVLEIHMVRFQSKLDRVNRGGYSVSLFTQKNSFAPDKRRIRVNMLWEKEETDDPLHPRKRMYWDWHTATAEALKEWMAQSASHRKAIMDIVDINEVSKHRLWSDTLGISEDSPVDYYTVGRMIDTNKEIRQRLRAVIGIEPMNHFRPGVPLAEIYRTASYAGDDSLDSIYIAADHDLSAFSEVTEALAGQVQKDRERVAAQRKDEALYSTEDDFNALAGDRFDD
jgi:RecA/RadA recombinase